MGAARRYFQPLLGMLLICLAAGVYAVEFSQVQTNKSTLSFAYRQMGVPLQGKFNKFVVRLNFDPARINAAQARFEVDLASIDTGTSEGDDEVRGKQWFNTRAFPSARFVSTGVKALGGNRYLALGTLTIKGRTRNVTAPFVFKQQGMAGTFDGAFTLKRLDYAIGEGAWADVSTVADEIQIRFHILANAAAPVKK